MSLSVLVLSNLFPSPWDPQRSAFNRQQFERLAQREGIKLEVMTAIDLRQRLGGRRGNPGLEYVRAHHFNFVYPPRVGRALHARFWLASLLAQRWQYLRHGGFDCLLASWAYPDGVAVSWLARYLGVPYAIKVHGSDLNVLAERPAQRQQISKALQGASAVIAVSRALAEKAVALGADAKSVHVLYNGVDAQRFQPGPRSAARERLSLPVDAELILYVGNLKFSKGCLDLVESLPALIARRPEVRVLMVGTGPDRAALEKRIAALDLGAYVQLVGPVRHQDLRDWFVASNLLCLPSHNEGVPNVVLEAMACGVPIVATRVGGIPEVVPEFAGRLVEVANSAQLSTTLETALAQTWDTTRIVEHAGGFRWDDNIDRLHAILLGMSGDDIRNDLVPGQC